MWGPTSVRIVRIGKDRIDPMKRFFALALLGLAMFAGCGEEPKKDTPAPSTPAPAGEPAPAGGADAAKP